MFTASLKRSLSLVAILAAALLLAAPLAIGAEEVTRVEYKAKVEPICKSNTEANEKILKGVRAKVKAGKLKAAAGQFARAATALKRTLVQLRAVPRPEADRARLAKWLGYVKVQAELLKKVSDKLAAGNRVAAQSLVVRLTHNATVANNTVAAFEFVNCRFNPSKFQ